jgi:putative DNA primase/helicase
LNFDPRADSDGNGQVSEFEPLADARPLTLAQAFLRFAGHAATATKPLTLRHWRQELYEFDGSVYRKVKAEQFYAELKLFLNQQAVTKQGNRGQWAEPVNATKKVVSEVMDQLRVICQVPEDVMPQWLDAHRPDAGNVIAFKNGWIDISKYLLGEQGIQNPITPFWFSQNLIPYDFRSGVGCPNWLEFLNSSLEGDAERIQLVQEWFGYCLTTDTRLQNILWLQGPPASGKSTTCGVLSTLLGRGNFSSPNLATLSEKFGLEDLLGSNVAIVPEADFGRKDDAKASLAVLKRITGGDLVNVQRKYLTTIQSVKLPVRFTIASNSVPTMPDNSAAIRRRLLVLPYKKSQEGREDRDLASRIAAEVDGVVQWALDGLRTLRLRGNFVQPQIGLDIIDDIVRLGSPVRCFVDDWCDVGQGLTDTTAMLYRCFEVYAKNAKRGIEMGPEQFGAALESMGFDKYRPSTEGKRANSRRGLSVKLERRMTSPPEV